ncbi:AAA family ATPase [Mycobacterium camsae]|uniref:AAA family ATPase n=1 Tax=Mycobacterium gordonae TaxID=1778 RepID=UPI001981D249|nr:AAA family ATPase [Mycobacterium gordonae]
MIVITGIQAAGKSTVAQALAETLPNSVHVRGDVFRRMIVNGGADMGAAVLAPEALRQLQLRYELAAATADRYARAGFTVVLQDIILGEHVQHVVDHIESRPLYLVVLAPSIDTVVERDAERQRTRGKFAYQPGGADVATFDHRLRSMTPRIGYWLDTTELTVADTVANILAHLDSSARVAW